MYTSSALPTVYQVPLSFLIRTPLIGPGLSAEMENTLSISFLTVSCNRAKRIGGLVKDIKKEQKTRTTKTYTICDTPYIRPYVDGCSDRQESS
jgi:hypothetical protein